MEPVTQNSESLQTDGGYGWVCVAACWIFNAFTWGGVSVRLLPKSSALVLLVVGLM